MFGTKPFSERMVNHSQLNSYDRICNIIWIKIHKYSVQKMHMECGLQNGHHLVSAVIAIRHLLLLHVYHINSTIAYCYQYPNQIDWTVTFVNLPHVCSVTHIFIAQLYHHFDRWWTNREQTPSHYFNHDLAVTNFSEILIKTPFTFEGVACKTSAILFWPQWLRVTTPLAHLPPARHSTYLYQPSVCRLLT